MIIIENLLISNLPVLEIVKKSLYTNQLATVFFYHGWESNKERVLEEGYQLARAGFRVILPEAYNHGERNEKKHKKQDPLTFWTVVRKSIEEFPILVNHYINAEKTLIDRVGVSGLSMGGIITSGILTQFDWVKSASILMGSPAPIDFTEWLIENYQMNSALIEKRMNKNEIRQKLTELAPISLNLQPEKIAGRPVYFWHGTNDRIVPANLTKDFVKETQKMDYGKNVHLELTDGVGHRVPSEIIQKMTKYFQTNL